MKCLQHFRLSHGLADKYPVPLYDLALFIAFLSAEKYAPATAVTYVAAIGYFHKLHDWQDPTEKFIIRRMLDGFSRKTGKGADVRQPITLEMLKKITHALPHVCTNTYEACVYHAAFTLAFFGFMRVSEITAECNSANQGALSVSDVQLRKENSLQALHVSLRHSKNNQNGPPQLIAIPCQVDHAICPVKAMQRYIDIRPAGAAPLFCHYDTSPVTRTQFNAVLHKAISFANIPGYFGSHSFRIGAATTAAMQGVPDTQIQEMGRWRSTAFKTYIRIPVSCIGNH